MSPLQLVPSKCKERARVHSFPAGSTDKKSQDPKACVFAPIPEHAPAARRWCGPEWPSECEGFFRDLSIKARIDFESLATRSNCPGARVLIREEQKPISVLLLLGGEVKISMNSQNGRRILLRIAHPGELLGLTSALSGDSSEIQAEAMYPCQIAAMLRQDFLDLLLRHPTASQSAARELRVNYLQVCKRLRIFALTPSASARLALLLFEWASGGLETKSGTQFHCSFTQAEIGECIGASRETVTRTFTDFRNHDLLEIRGSTLIVRSRIALAAHVGLDPEPNYAA
jgi:CRP/FNR family cyclic AMP-dependent transcriptional regulator